MKIAEICVGNYVYNKDNELCKVCVVDLITNSVIVDNYAHDDGTFYEYAIEEIKPVPLTPEILEKNGFKHDEIHDVYECSAPNGIVVTVGLYDPYYVVIDRVYSDEEGEEYVDTLTDYMKPNESDMINVHDLQIVLRLFCIEKEIVL